MSLTRTRGVFGASRWVSVCASVVEHLDSLLGTLEGMGKTKVPKGAIMALQDLLSSALQATQDESVAKNPAASISDYLVVQKAISKGGMRNPKREDVGKAIRKYSAVLDRLSRSSQTENPSPESLVETRIFFRNLQDLGQRERYDARMRQAHPYNHPETTPDDDE